MQETEKYLRFKNQLAGTDPACRRMVDRATNWGQRKISSLPNATELIKDINRCKHAGPRTECRELYDQLYDTPPINKLDAEQLAQVIECKDRPQTWTEYGAEQAAQTGHAIQSVYQRPGQAALSALDTVYQYDPGLGIREGMEVAATGYKAYQDPQAAMQQVYEFGATTGNAIWDGTKWVAGTTKQIGAVVAGKVWDGIKWVSGQGFDAGAVVGSAIWDGSKWVTGIALNAGTSVAGKVWDGTKWVAGQVGEVVQAGKMYLQLKTFRWLVYIFLLTQVIIEVFSTVSELFGIHVTIGTRITVIVLTVLQMIWAIGGIRLGEKSIQVALWIGLAYYLSVLIGSVATGALQIYRIRKYQEQEKSSVFIIISLIAKALQVLAVLIFGVLFLIRKTPDGYRELPMYSVLVISCMEVIIQALNFFGLS